MKLKKVQLIISIVIGLTVIVGTILTVNNYFAKTEDVNIKVEEIQLKVDSKVEEIEEEHRKLETRDELVQERLDISITDDQIFQQQQHIQQMRNLRVFEVRSSLPELTPMESAAMESAEGRLDELKVKKATKIRRYEEMKKGGEEI